MSLIHQNNAGFIGRRVDLPSAEPAIDCFASFLGTPEPTYKNWYYSITNTSTIPCSSVDGQGYITSNHGNLIFSRALLRNGSWTLELEAKANVPNSSPEWVCLWTALDQYHRPMQIGQFHNFGNPGTYDAYGNQHHRSGVTTHDGNYHHYMWSMSNGSYSFYVDGVLRISGRSASGWPDHIYGLRIGGWNFTTEYPAQHWFRNLRVTYNVARTSPSALPVIGGNARTSGVYKLGDETALASFTSAGAAPTRKVGTIATPTGPNSFSMGHFGVDKAFWFENGRTYTTFKIVRPSANAQTIYPCIVGKDHHRYTPIAGFTCNIPSGGAKGDILTFNIADMPGRYGSFTVPFGGRYWMGWHSGIGSGASGQIGPQLVTETSDAGSGLIDYLATTTLPALGGSYVMALSNTVRHMQMEWS